MKIILSLLFFAFCAFASATSGVAGWQSFGGSEGDAPAVSVIESGTDHLVLKIDIPGFWLYDYPSGGRVWDRVELPGFYPQGDVGMPELPSVTELFALPYGTTARVSVTDVQSTEYAGIDVLPRQTPEIDMDHPPFPFVIDGDYYNGGNVYPVSWAVADQGGTWSGLNVERLVVNPFRFDPSSGKLVAASSITVRIDFTGVPGDLAEPVNPAMIPAMQDMVVNWNDFQAAADPAGGFRDDGVEYIFVCTEDKVDLVADLFETHHFLGLRTRVETLPAPATVSEIKAVIDSDYTAGVTRFACLVGDNDELPSYSYGDFVGDYYYAIMDGGLYADIAIGRITGDSAKTVIQVNKIINDYSHYDFASANTPGIIPSEALLAAHEEEYPGKYTLCCNQIASYSYDLCDLTFTKLFPPEGATKDDVIENIEGNIGTVGYRGHGSSLSWSWSPGWSSYDAYALENDFAPPVFNIACLNGQYQYPSMCLSEGWQWSEHGACSNLGANTSSYTIPNHDYMKQIYIDIFDAGIYRACEAVMAATTWVINAHGSLGITNSRMYIWFGDPALDIWTFDTADEPGVLTISHPTNILPGVQDITLTVTDDGNPVEGADVTITDGVENYGDGMTFYQEGTTDSQGQVTFNVDIPSDGTVYMGARKHDYLYDIRWVQIGTGIEGGGETSPQTLWLSGTRPNPVTSTASVGFTVPSSGNVSLTVYDVSGRMVDNIFQGQVDAGTSWMQWEPSGSISSGMYFLRLDTPDGSLTQRAMVIR